MIQDASRKNSRAENRRRRRKKKEQITAAAAVSTPAISFDNAVTYRQVISVLNNDRKSEEKSVAGNKELSSISTAVPKPPPPPPLPPTPPSDPSLDYGRQNRTDNPSLVVNMNGNSKTLPLPVPPHYVQTALSFRKQRTSSHNSASELSDSKDKSSSSGNSVKKSGPFKKIVKKFF